MVNPKKFGISRCAKKYLKWKNGNLKFTLLRARHSELVVFRHKEPYFALEMVSLHRHQIKIQNL